MPLSTRHLWAVVLSGALTSVGATAGVADTSTSAERHCVTRAETGQVACFPTFADAARAASDGMIDLPGGGRWDVTSPAFQGQVAAAGRRVTERVAEGRLDQQALAAVWLSIEYDLPWYGGSSMITTGGSPCDGDLGYEHGMASLAGYGWDNAISSFIGYNHCQVEHWTGYSYTGAVNYGTRDDLFPWQVDNQTSSLRFY